MKTRLILVRFRPRFFKGGRLFLGALRWRGRMLRRVFTHSILLSLEKSVFSNNSQSWCKVR